MQEIWEVAESMRETAPYGKVGEEEYQELTEDVCDADTDMGEWMSMQDVTQAQKGASLKLEQQEHLGECRRECRTIEKACKVGKGMTE